MTEAWRVWRRKNGLLRGEEYNNISGGGSLSFKGTKIQIIFLNKALAEKIINP